MKLNKNHLESTFSKYHRETLLVFLAVVFQLISCLNYYGVNSHIDPQSLSMSLGHTVPFPYFYLDSKLWAIIGALAKLAGAYVFANWFIRNSMYKTLCFVSRLFFCFNLLFAILLSFRGDIILVEPWIYIFRGFICFLHPVVHIFSGIYLYQKTPEHTWGFVSATIVAAISTGCFISGHLIINISQQMWVCIPVITSVLAWIIFLTLKETPSVEKLNTSYLTICPTKIKALAVAFGGVWTSLLSYNPIFFKRYMLDVNIIETDRIFSPKISMVIFLIGLVPGVILHKVIGFYKVALITLLTLFFLTLMPMYVPGDIFFLHQIAFAIASGIFTAPFLLVLYKFMQPYKNMFDLIFWFFAGCSLCMVLAVFQKPVAAFFGFHHVDWWVYNASFGLCLVAVVRCKDLFNLPEVNTDK